jgi:hypothetical protein
MRSGWLPELRRLPGLFVGVPRARRFRARLQPWRGLGTTAAGPLAEGYSELRFGFGGLSAQIAMLRDADFAIAPGGNVGTLEPCMAVKLARPIVVRDLPGVAARFPALLAELSVYPAAPPPITEVGIEALPAIVRELALRVAA